MRIHTGGMAAFRSASFRPPSDRDINYLRDRLQTKAMQYEGVARRYETSALDMYDSITSSDAMLRARALWRRSNTAYAGTYMRDLRTVLDFQQASPDDQRYIMANPKVREAYHRQRISGYEGSYVDYNPGMIGDQHIDYRIVTDGLLYTPKDEPDRLCFDVHYDLPDDEALDPGQVHNVLDAWTLAEHFLSLNDADITSVFGSKM